MLGSLFVHGELDRATLTGNWKGLVLELYGEDHPLSEDAFKSVIRWGLERELVTWGPSGRPRERHHVMRLSPLWGFAIGVVLGHQSIRCGLGDARGELVVDADGPLLEGRAAPQLEHSQPAQVFGMVAEMASSLVQRAKVDEHLIRGITVALPAPVDLDGRLSSTRILRGLTSHEDLRPAVQDALAAIGLGDLAIDIDNDANVAGVGEWWLRQRNDPPPTTLLVVKVSGGIGGALIEPAGRVLRGATGAAGELGHLPADPEILGDPLHGLPSLKPEAPCTRCGGHGHLESYASAPAIADRVFGQNGSGDYGERHRQLMAALEAPDSVEHQAAVAAVRDAGTLLGRALIPVVEFVDPDLIVIAGRMRNAGETLTSSVDKALHHRDHIVSTKPPVVASQYGWSGVLGAIRNTLRNEPPPFDDELAKSVLGPLLRDMRTGPSSWRAAAELLGPSRRP
ncbi:ROK family protein [Baekduia sp. Peel2402]|uniref:ROK family protein n=1 Tax=Baekduia sp. Peel2402 TaxID=3458296 RepID=UPI00403EF4C5